MTVIYEIPSSVEEIFRDVEQESGWMPYRIINYNEEMYMDNNESMEHFIYCVGISSEYIVEHLGTQITLTHPEYDKRIIIDAGGLGDFFSHGYECYWHEEDL